MEKTILSMRKKIKKNKEYNLTDILILNDIETLELVNELNDMMIYWFEKTDSLKEELSYYRRKKGLYVDFQSKQK